MCNTMDIQIHSIEEYDNLQRDMKTFNKIKNIVFTSDFNNIINIFPNSLISIIFIWNSRYNQPLPSLQDTNVKLIRFGNYYNLPLLSLQNTKLKYIQFGEYYNQPLPSLQNTKIKYIKFGNNYNQPLPSLQYTNIKYIIFGWEYNQPLPSLQYTRIKYIRFGEYYNQSLPDLQYAKIKKIIFGFYYSYKNYKRLYSTFSAKIKNTPYLQTVFILKESYNIKKHRNQIFNIIEIYNAYKIKKILNPYLKYIIYNNIFIPFEIYNYIYYNYNFIYAN